MKKVIIFSIISLILIFLASFFGSIKLSLFDIIHNQESFHIWINMRLPRIILGFLAGSALSLCGMAYQSIFRNPLAEPYTLGISTGATLGCVICVVLGITGTFLSIGLLPIFAFLGALLSVIIVYFISKNNFSTSYMLLAGIGINFFFSALILLFQYFGNEYNLAKIMHWTMGGLDIIGFDRIYQIIPFYLIGMFFIFRSTRELNLLSISEEIAITRGVNIQKLKKVIFVSSSLMIGSICATTGPIGFIGMICPHIMRLIFGYDNRIISIVSIFFGGLFLVICDVFSRTILIPLELPVGIITSLLGGPFFIYLLINENKKGKNKRKKSIYL